MERHRLTGMSDIELSLDHRFATMVLHTHTAPPFALEIEVQQTGDFIAQLLSIALHAGSHGAARDTPSPGCATSSVPVPTSSMGLQMGPQGHSLLIFRVGHIDLALQIENSCIEPIGRALVAHSTRLAAEPSRAQ